ncbi:MAG: MGMT family protein [Candidatus Micrarchaeaceae archaeon]
MELQNIFIKRILERKGLSEFDVKVLLEAKKLRLGEVASYKQIAERIGMPNAYRAVGNALKKNPLPIIIPCHRVVGCKGIGGYKYGKAAKKLLLFIESNLKKIQYIATESPSSNT